MAPAPRKGTMKLTRIDPQSAGRMMGAVYAAIGLLAGAMFSMFSMLGALGARTTASGIFAFVFGIGSIIFFPILYGVLGFVSGVFTAWLYNLLAEKIGGLELELH